MAFSQGDLQTLRAEASRAMRLNKRKLNRLRNNGVTIMGRHAPRMVEQERINRYTGRQLQSLIANSEGFRSRRSQFVPSSTGVAIPRSKFRRLDRAQKTRRSQIEAANARVDDIYIDHLGKTVGERRQEVSPGRARHLENNMSVEFVDKTPDNFISEEGLEKTTARLEAHNTGGEVSRARSSAMESLDPMFQDFMDAAINGNENISADMSDVADLIADIEELSDEQFHVLWSIRDFANDAKRVYVSLEALQSPEISGMKNTALNDGVRTALRDMRGLVNSVQEIQFNGG